MAGFAKLDEFLTPDYHPDIWYDLDLFHATDLLESLDTTGWEQLFVILPLRSNRWQERLAEAAYGFNDPRVLRLFRQLLQSSDINVALAAVAGLEAMADLGTPEPAMRARVEGLLTEAPPGYGPMLNSLLARL